jgi:hypothetical protein
LFIDPAKLIPLQRFLPQTGKGGVTKRGKLNNQSFFIYLNLKENIILYH